MIYDKVRFFADKQNMSLTEVESKAGIANGLIGKWRDTVPRVDNLLAVARVLSITVNDLLADDMADDPAEQEAPHAETEAGHH